MVDRKPSILIQGLHVDMNTVASVAREWLATLCCWLFAGLGYSLSNRIIPAQSRLVAGYSAVPAVRRGGAV
jgi:hypothetical protein